MRAAHTPNRSLLEKPAHSIPDLSEKVKLDRLFLPIRKSQRSAGWSWLSIAARHGREAWISCLSSGCWLCGVGEPRVLTKRDAADCGERWFVPVRREAPAQTSN